MSPPSELCPDPKGPTLELCPAITSTGSELCAGSMVLSSELCDVSEAPKCSEGSEAVGEEGPALDTALEGPLLHQGGLSLHGSGREDGGERRIPVDSPWYLHGQLRPPAVLAAQLRCVTVARNASICLRESELCSVSKGQIDGTME